jgi:hypothetical protein
MAFDRLFLQQVHPKCCPNFQSYVGVYVVDKAAAAAAELTMECHHCQPLNAENMPVGMVMVW